ncbi:hypothetical protein [Curtobacterium sp. Leaf261]|uniref:hypothetical protein n=1 Tax=Curtobacterium sp. Leaf261 TaxID=1736311 RepID=UPI000AC1160B|nr:hypothetical protein [Curtobacterium sp. Leaf261]
MNALPPLPAGASGRIHSRVRRGTTRRKIQLCSAAAVLIGGVALISGGTAAASAVTEAHNSGTAHCYATDSPTSTTVDVSTQRGGTTASESPDTSKAGIALGNCAGAWLNGNLTAGERLNGMQIPGLVACRLDDGSYAAFPYDRTTDGPSNIDAYCAARGTSNPIEG